MKIRCGVSGLGRGQTFIPKLSAHPDCDVVAVCDLNPRALEAFSGLQTYTDFDEMLGKADLDMVVCIGPGPTHFPQAMAALNAGVHVLSETPCVYSLDEARQIVDTVRRTGLRYMLSEDYIYMGWCQRLKQIVDSGALGRIVYAEGEYTHDCRGAFFMDADGRYIPHDEWLRQGKPRLAWRATDLPPLTYCSHTLGPILYLMEDRCTRVVGLNTGSQSLPDSGAIDVEACLCHTTSDAVIRLTNGFSVAHPFGYWLSLCGSKGSLRMMALDWPLGNGWPKVYLHVDGEDATWREEALPGFERADGRDWLTAILHDYVDAIVGDTEPPLDVYKSMECTLPGVCGHESGQRGGAIMELPDLRA